MSLKLLSCVKADRDLIQAWLKYYPRLSVDQFHPVVHGAPEENISSPPSKIRILLPLKTLTGD